MDNTEVTTLTSTLSNQLENVTTLYKTGAMSEPLFYKALLSLAAEYMAVGEIFYVQCLLRRVPATYLQDTLEIQLREDHVFRQMSVALSQMLIEKDVVYSGPRFNFWGPVAVA